MLSDYYGCPIPTINFVNNLKLECHIVDIFMLQNDGLLINAFDGSVN